MKTIVTLTMNPSVDVSATVDEVVPDVKLRCSAPRHDPGGGGVNVARAVRRLGGAATALWTSGGPFGQVLHELLDQEGVSHHPIPIADWTRQALSIHSRDHDYRFGFPGPELDDAEADLALKVITTVDADFLVLSGSLPPGVRPDFYARVVQRARPNTRVVLDTSGEALRCAAERGVWLLKPNRRELGQLVGRALADDELAEAAERLVQQGSAQIVAVSMGSGGLLVATAGGVERFEAPRVEVQSTIGAGDSTVAGLVLALSRGLSLRDAARFGVAAGTAAVMTPGSELCRKEDAEQLYEQLSGALEVAS